jgi:hypothetical protein
VCALVDAGLAITIDGTHSLGDYQGALARLEHGEQLGKIVLTREEN